MLRSLHAYARIKSVDASNTEALESDPETGKVSLLRFAVVQDAGKAIQPSYVDGPMQGGNVKSIV